MLAKQFFLVLLFFFAFKHILKPQPQRILLLLRKFRVSYYINMQHNLHTLHILFLSCESDFSLPDCHFNSGLPPQPVLLPLFAIPGFVTLLVLPPAHLSQASQSFH